MGSRLSGKLDITTTLMGRPFNQTDNLTSTAAKRFDQSAYIVFITHGSVIVTFMVYQDFMTYKSGFISRSLSPQLDTIH